MVNTKKVLNNLKKNILKPSSNIKKTFNNTKKIREDIKNCRAKKCAKILENEENIKRCYEHEMDEYKKHIDEIMFKLLSKYGIEKKDIDRLHKIKDISKRRKLAYELVDGKNLDMKKIKKESQIELRKLEKYKEFKLNQLPELEICDKKYDMTLEDLLALEMHCQETRCAELDKKLLNSTSNLNFINKLRSRQRKHFQKIKSRKNIQKLLN